MDSRDNADDGTRLGASHVNDDGHVEGFIYGTEIIELNVGGVLYTTTANTLMKDNESLLTRMFSLHPTISLPKDPKGRLFIDRDGVLFRYILDYLRHGRLVLPENFYEKERLRAEAEHFKLRRMVRNLDNTAAIGNSLLFLPDKNQCLTSSTPALQLQSPLLSQNPSSPEFSTRMAFVTVGYRGTFFGNMGHAEMKDVKFRKLSRILIHGKVRPSQNFNFKWKTPKRQTRKIDIIYGLCKVAVCREVFGETLNESRDPDRGANDRYSSRFFLKHNHLEQAFDHLGQAGFRMICGCASGTNSSYETPKPGSDNEESKWQHYNEYVFQRT